MPTALAAWTCTFRRAQGAQETPVTARMTVCRGHRIMPRCVALQHRLDCSIACTILYYILYCILYRGQISPQSQRLQGGYALVGKPIELKIAYHKRKGGIQVCARIVSA